MIEALYAVWWGPPLYMAACVGLYVGVIALLNWIQK